MQFTIATIVAFLAATATAAPGSNWRDDKSKGNNKDAGRKGDWDAKAKSPFQFTSTYRVRAIGANVINQQNVATPGPANATGYMDFGINTFTEQICYNITLFNVEGGYQSPALTATHIHEAVAGRAGPPRLAFPNPGPVENGKRRNSAGCLTGPFKTGVKMADGRDTADGFKLSQIEANPSGFFSDSHTVFFPAGVVRGQLA